ncbi:hypothetical protein HAX54_031772 [Datura stramonium]|uniref:Uncharacterized protein n=1 Tax=Datura stramonium TaxID=4076 RepID=A0ABS8V9L2_DATST|nr:hypothetical protein [Datura stramonium]
MASDPSSAFPDVPESPSFQEQPYFTANLASSSPSHDNPSPTTRHASPSPIQEKPISVPPLASLPPLIEGNLSPSVESVGNPSPTSSVPIDLETLISDIRNRYVPHESIQNSPSPTCSAPTDYTFVSGVSNNTPDTLSLLNSESEEDLVPIEALNKGARKRVLASSQAVEFVSKTPCVFGPASRTRACRNTQGGTPPIPKPIVPKSKVKPFFERKLLKVKMVFPTSDPCLAKLWLKIEAQGWTPLFSDRNAFVAKPENHALPYGFSLTRVFAKLGVQFSSLEYYSTYDALNYFETRCSRQVGGMGGSSSVVGSSPTKEPYDTVRLQIENKSLCLDIGQLKDQLA